MAEDLNALNAQLAATTAQADQTDRIAAGNKKNLDFLTQQDMVQKDLVKSYETALLKNEGLSAIDRKRLTAAKTMLGESAKAKKEAEIYRRTQSDILEGLKAQGKTLAINLHKMKESTMENGKFHAGKAMGAIAGGAKDIEANTIAALGPWGQIVKMIVDVIDGVRQTRSELTKAAADTYSFADAYGAANRESINTNKNVAELMVRYGRSKDEVIGLTKALKSSGFRDFGADVVSADGHLNDFAKNALGMADATGQSIDALVGQYAAVRRTFMDIKSSPEAVAKAYKGMYAQGKALANQGLGIKPSEWTAQVMGLGDAFSSVGMSMKSIGDVAGTVTRAIGRMGYAIKDSAKITQQLLGAVNATSDGWKVLIGQQSGMGGGFAETLFGMQQRGANMKMPGAGGFDAATFVKQMGGAIQKLTGGIGGASGQYVTEQVTKSMGLDAQSTAVLQELQNGTISQEEAEVSMNKIADAAKEAAKDSKGMFEILKTILIGMIAKPIIMIYDAITQMLGIAQDPSMAGAKDAMNKMSSGANGLELLTGGMVMGHAKEQMVGGKLLPVASTRPLNRDAASGGGGSNQFSFNINIDEGNISRQFKEMENKTVRLMKKQQAGNFST